MRLRIEMSLVIVHDPFPCLYQLNDVMLGCPTLFDCFLENQAAEILSDKMRFALDFLYTKEIR